MNNQKIKASTKIDLKQLLSYLNNLDFPTFCEELFDADYKEDWDGYYKHNYKMMENDLLGFLNKCDWLRRSKIEHFSSKKGQ